MTKKKISAAEARKALDPETQTARPDRDEILDLLGAQARAGHVPAMRLLLEEYRRDGNSDEEASNIIDELAQRRASAVR